MIEIITAINEATTKHDKVVVFTQDHSLVRSFLEATHLRGNVAVNNRLWPNLAMERSDYIHDLVKPGYKLGFDHGSDVNVVFGFDAPGKVVFTKNFFRPLHKSEFYIKTPFSFPKIHFQDKLVVPRKIDKKVRLIMRNRVMLERMAIKFHLEGLNQIQLDDKITYADEMITVLHGMVPTDQVMALHSASHLTIVQPVFPEGFLEIETLLKCFKVLSNFPLRVMDLQQFAFQTMMNPKHLLVYLDVLELYGVIRRVFVDKSIITIKKVHPPEDQSLLPTYEKFTEGRFFIKDLSQNFNCTNLGVIQMLQSIENKGLIFAYTEGEINQGLSLNRVVDKAELIKIINEVNQSLNFMNDIEQIDSKLERRIERFCTSREIKWISIKDGTVSSRNTDSRPISEALGVDY